LEQRTRPGHNSVHQKPTVKFGRRELAAGRLGIRAGIPCYAEEGNSDDLNT
jgi:hypothetical protein